MLKPSSILGLFSLIMLSFLMCQSDIPSEKVSLDWKNPSDLVKQMQALEYHKQEKWVEEQLASMSEDEKIGQLMMVASYPTKGAADEKRVIDLIEKEQIGGVIIFKGEPTYIASLTNLYQSKAPKTKLLMAIDGEWGPSMRVDSILRFPRQMLMGAIQDNRLLYEFGKEVARQCRLLGIHINFAPVVDVNNNPANPVIGDRSFGEIRENVTAKSFQYMQGMQDHGVIACAKHFPGHGDTDVDSHHDLPVLTHSMARLDSLELFPFRNLIQHGIQSIMVAHLHIPAIDPTPNVPTTLSKAAITDLLKNKMGFEGLVITDAMGMQGVAKHFANGEADARALVAGNDILLMSQDVALAKKKIKEVIKKGELNWEDLNLRVKKVLRAKYRMGLAEYTPVKLFNIVKEINSPEAIALYNSMINKALTLCYNPEELIPIKRIKGAKLASLSIGTGRKTVFQQELDKYGIENHHFAGLSIAGSIEKRLMANLKDQDIVFVGLHRVGKDPKDNYNVPASVRDFLKELNKHTKVVLVVFGNPYSLELFEDLKWVACAYVNDDSAEKLAAQALFGGTKFEGRLPITASIKYKFGTGVSTSTFRLAYANKPEDVGMSSEALKRIDEIANEAIREKATPGCQVLVVKDGKIAYHKAYGYTTYDKNRKVDLDDVYDLASVTKVAATTLAIMKLYEQGRLDINKKMGDYLPELKGTNKENLIIADVLAHQAGLKPWIPFYTKTLDENKKPQEKYYSSKATADYCVRVSEGLYLCQSQVDSVLWNKIYEVDQSNRKEYKYSDLGFYLFTRIIKNVSGRSLDEYLKEEFYSLMGLESIFFNPLEQGLAKNRIIPTEEDKYFRYGIVHGDVHDMGAAMLGGVAGHAGLFSTAIDLAAVFQMFVDGGVYQNRRYLKEETIRKFTSKYSNVSRRGLGFDRKEKTTGKESINVAYQASDNTFGHLGFTGIGAWGDPDNNIVYLFLSNRTYPSGDNMKLIKLNTRTRIQEAIYDAIISKK